MRSANHIAGDLRSIADELDTAARHVRSVTEAAPGASAGLVDRANLLRELARDLEALESGGSEDLIIL
ncbi:MAG: hypothetical protein RID91_07925 [Azospirillaceae bacterium]